MRYELYSLKCLNCGARNAPSLQRCSGCRGELAPIRRCNLCQNENPPNAYVCLTCYTVLKQKPQVGILHCQLPWTVPLLVIVVLLGWLGLVMGKHWLDYTEAQIETNAVLVKQMELQHREYEMREEIAEKEATHE